jgi:hypothetical protein
MIDIYVNLTDQGPDDDDWDLEELADILGDIR